MEADLDKLVLKFLTENKLDGADSSYENRVMDTKQGTVLYNHRSKKPQVFSFEHFKQIATPGEKVSDSNRLRELGYRVETCAENHLEFQMRVYTRQLNQALSSDKVQKPLIVYDNESWQDSDVELYSDTQEKLKHLARITFFNSESARSFNHVYPNYLRLKEYLEMQKSSNILK